VKSPKPGRKNAAQAKRGGVERAKYGNELIENLSKKLTVEF